MLRKTPLRPKRPTPRRKGTPAPRIKPERVEDPDHLARVRAHGCMICCWAPAEAHHIRDGQVGAGQKASDHEAIGLCSYHHRTGPIGEAFHAGPREWERRHGTQRELLARMMAALDAPETT